MYTWFSIFQTLKWIKRSDSSSSAFRIRLSAVVSELSKSYIGYQMSKAETRFVPAGRAPLNRGRAWSAAPQNLKPTVCNLFTTASAKFNS